jgi:hypothetical protein
MNVCFWHKADIQIDDVGTGSLFRPFDPLALLFLAQKLLQRAFILVLEFFRLELPFLAFDDVECPLKHVLADLFDLNYIEIVFCLANLVGTLERDGCFIRQPRRWAVPQPTKCGSGYEETKRTRLPPQAPTMRDHKVHLHSCRSGPS